MPRVKHIIGTSKKQLKQEERAPQQTTNVARPGKLIRLRNIRKETEDKLILIDKAINLLETNPNLEEMIDMLENIGISTLAIRLLEIPETDGREALFRKLINGSF